MSRLVFFLLVFGVERTTPAPRATKDVLPHLCNSCLPQRCPAAPNAAPLPPLPRCTSHYSKLMCKGEYGRLASRFTVALGSRLCRESIAALVSLKSGMATIYLPQRRRPCPPSICSAFINFPSINQPEWENYIAVWICWTIMCRASA